MKEAVDGSSAHPIELERLLAHADWLKGLARALTRDADEAAEVEQETWLAALRHPPRRERGDVRAWLATVARNLVRRRRRDAARRADHESRASTISTADDAATMAERVAWQRELADRVLALPETYRTAVALRYFEGLEPVEIAQRLSITPENARQRVARGLALLREELDRSHGSRAAWSVLVAPLARELSAPVAPAPLHATPRASSVNGVKASGSSVSKAWKGWLAVKSVQRVGLVVLVLLLGWFGWRAWISGGPPDEHASVAGTPSDASPARETNSAESIPSDPRQLASEVQPPAATANMAKPTGELVVLIHPSGPAPVNTRWRLESVGTPANESITVDVPENGRVRVPVGAWTLHELGGTWSATPRRVVIAQDEEALVWVGTKQAVDVLVVDARGAAIAGATVDWTLFGSTQRDASSADASTEPPATASARTDEQGRAKFAWNGIVQGILCVHAPGRPFEVLTLSAPQREPVRVVLGADDLPELELRIVDARTNQPRAEVELFNETTRASVRTDADGRARIRTSSPAEASFLVRGAGLFPMQIDPDGFEDHRPVRAVDSAQLVVRAGSQADAGEHATLAVRIVSVEPPIDGGPLPEVTVREIELPAQLALPVPLGAHLEVALVTAKGRGAWRELDIERATSDLALEFDANDVLELVLTGSRAALDGARVSPSYSGRALAALPHGGRATAGSDASNAGAHSRFTIPCAERLSRVTIEAPGCAPLQIKRNRNLDLAAHGEVEISLRPAEHVLDVTFVDEEGVPVPGVQLDSMDELQLEWFKTYPELHGARPTRHSAWNLEVLRLPARVSDAAGRVRLLLPSPARARLSWSLVGVDYGADAFPLIQTETRVVNTPDERELRWVLPRARRITLHAFDAENGAPIERFEVVDPDGQTSAAGSGQGGVWQGWVPARAQRLAVRASHERTGEVELPRWDPDHPDASVRVELGTLLTSTLVLEGPAAEELRGHSLRVIVEKAGKPESQQGMIDWQTVVPVDDPSNIPVAIPLRDALVSLYEEQRESGPYRYRFTPVRLAWRQGERNVTRVERR